MPDNPTPVNISDLPVALSANGVNLVGDDNGTTKQVPVNLLADEIAPADIGAVPSTRKVNGKALSADISLSASDVGAQAAIDGGTIDLSLSWNGSGPYTQTITVTGAIVTSNSMISLLPTATQLASLIADGVTALTIENNVGTLTAYALGAAPTSAMTIACTVTEVSA